MTDAFATLNPDLLHLCLSHLQAHTFAYGGRAVARAGATCKHWRAVASTERLWREICVKRWPSTAKLSRAPPSHLEYYKQRTVRNYAAPSIALNRLTLLVDGLCGGDSRFSAVRFSAVLSFADATPCRFQPFANPPLADAFSGFEWSVPELHELLHAEEEFSDLDFDADILCDDGKIASAGHFEAIDFDKSDDGTDKFSWTSEPLDLEHHAEFVTRVHERWFYLHAEYNDGKLKVCASNRLDHNQAQWDCVDLSHALALLDWK